VHYNNPKQTLEKKHHSGIIMFKPNTTETKDSKNIPINEYQNYPLMNISSLKVLRTTQYFIESANVQDNTIMHWYIEYESNFISELNI
jgi:hypothetical protein